MSTPVTLVTARAEHDNLSSDDYRDIYRELREHKSLDAFISLIASQYSKAWWSKYERSEIKLTREARNELRRAIGLQPLPISVGEAMADVDPDAEVWRVGDQRPDRVILIGLPKAVEGLVIRLNGKLEITPGRGVTTVTSPRPKAKRQRVSLSTNLFERLNSARVRQGKTWATFLAPLLANEEDVDANHDAA